MLRAHGITDRGRVRATNEDCYAIDDGLRLCVIADGMGGHSAGEVASRMAVDAIVEYVGRFAVTTTWPYGFDPAISEVGNLLGTAVHIANQTVFEAASATPDYVGMGTTIVAAMERDGLLSVAHAGDSRLYVFANHVLRRLTEDDSWAATILAHDPNMDPSTLQRHPMRHALTNVVGARPQTLVHLAEHALVGGERLLMITDGIHGVLEDATLARLIESSDVRDTAASLIDAALEAGSRDNCTAVVIDYVKG